MSSITTPQTTPINHFSWQAWMSRFSEAIVWVVVLTVLITVRVFAAHVFDDRSTLWITGLILAFALTYYTLIYHYFNAKQRHYIKDIADVIFIGILGTVAKDYSIYLFSLYILPIAAAAFALDTLNSLVIATVASLFIAGNIILNTSVFATATPLYFGTFQIVLLVILTLFTRALALQLRSEQSERQFFEGQLRKVDQRLEDVEAIEQEFVSITTHQLNTPLSIIRGYTSMLLEGDAGALNDKQGRYVKEVHAGSLRLMKMIQDLLAITHLDRDEFLAHYHQPVILNQILPTAIDTLQDKAGASHITLALDLPKEQLVIMGNDTHLAEALKNLVDNAIKYSDKGKAVEIAVSKEKGATGEEVMIAVTDHGMGIPEDEQSRIFQRFYRATNSMPRDAQGTGLGLYIVKRIVEYHGGSISFESVLNQGTTFKLRFPLVKTTSAPIDTKKLQAVQEATSSLPSESRDHQPKSPTSKSPTKEAK